MKPSEKFKKITDLDYIPWNVQKILHNRHDKHCVVLFFYRRSKNYAYMIIKANKNFYGFQRIIRRYTKEERSYYLYEEGIKEIIHLYKKLQHSRNIWRHLSFEDPKLMKELYEWRVLNAI